MRALIITEKSRPDADLRDGGAQVVETLMRLLKGRADTVQFGSTSDRVARYHFIYPDKGPDRFARRLANAAFIAKEVQKLSAAYTHLIYVHISMQFEIASYPPKGSPIIWTFPMFLTPSYRLSGEQVSQEYFAAEKLALQLSTKILTPSPMEKRQLCDSYGVDEEDILMIPRGIHPSLRALRPRILNGPLRFCSVGSIKHQKNTLELIGHFCFIRKHFPKSTLSIIGPTQHAGYGRRVKDEIALRGLEPYIELMGHVSHQTLPEILADCHFHLMASKCETFGRSIFETLALGLPNIVWKGEHAALDFLKHSPYVSFVRSAKEAAEEVKRMVGLYTHLSEMACEIGELFDEQFLGKRLIAALLSTETLAVSDYDGTLFHKEDPEKTKRCFEAFKAYPKKILCSARPLGELIDLLDLHQCAVDWIVSQGGAVIATGKGECIKSWPLTRRDKKELDAASIRDIRGNIQAYASAEKAPEVPSLRREIYQEQAFYQTWRASKLHAVRYLLEKINWQGKVIAFGDGKYDEEMITYFDGKRIGPEPRAVGEQEEVSYVSNLL